MEKKILTLFLSFFFWYEYHSHSAILHSVSESIPYLVPEKVDAAGVVESSSELAVVVAVFAFPFASASASTCVGAKAFVPVDAAAGVEFNL